LITVNVSTEYLEWKAINQGDRQGCSLPPLLFIVYMKDLIRKWWLNSRSTVTINKNLKLDFTLRFADDQVVLKKLRGRNAMFYMQLVEQN